MWSSMIYTFAQPSHHSVLRWWLHTAGWECWLWAAWQDSEWSGNSVPCCPWSCCTERGQTALWPTCSAWQRMAPEICRWPTLLFQRTWTPLWTQKDQMDIVTGYKSNQSTPDFLQVLFKHFKQGVWDYRKSVKTNSECWLDKFLSEC